MPVIRDLLSNLKHVGYELPQALHQLSLSLTTGSGSAAAGDGCGQARGAAEARDLLAQAALRASELGALLEAAQGAIESPSSRVSPGRRNRCVGGRHTAGSGGVPLGFLRSHTVVQSGAVLPSLSVGSPQKSCRS